MRIFDLIFRRKLLKDKDIINKYYWTIIDQGKYNCVIELIKYVNDDYYRHLVSSYVYYVNDVEAYKYQNCPFTFYRTKKSNLFNLEGLIKEYIKELDLTEIKKYIDDLGYLKKKYVKLLK